MTFSCYLVTPQSFSVHNWSVFESKKMDYTDYLCLSPIHIEKNQQRLAAILRLKENISATIKTVQRYAGAGTQLSNCMKKLAVSFKAYNEFQSDPTIRTISDLLTSFGDSLMGHYAQIEPCIVAPLRDFIKKDIAKVEEAAKVAARDTEIYLKTLDVWAALNKKKVKPTDQDKQERDGRLMSLHQVAIRSDFIYDRSLSFVERKKLVDVTAVVCFPCVCSLANAVL